MSVPEEILKKVKLLEVRTRRLVNNIFVGEYHSAFKGQGMTFAEFREYVAGDDVRSIAWPLMARTGKVYIKKHDEEREMTVVLAVDVSGSQGFGSRKYLKGEAVAHLSALVGFAASLNKDAVGLLLFSDQVELFVPPKKGPGQIHRILREIYYFKPRSKRTSIEAASDFLLGVLKKRSHIFLFSDFLDSGFEMPLRLLARKHDAVAVIVQDPMERQIPAFGLVDLEDPETGQIITVDTTSPIFQRDYKAFCLKQEEARELEFRRAQIDMVRIRTDQDLVQPLVAFFQKETAVIEVPVWHCEVKALSDAGSAQMSALTVGTKFSLECSGDIAVTWKGNPHIELPEKTPEYALVILKTEKLETNSATFLVTSYRTGAMKPEFVRVLGDGVGFEAAGLQWNVQSVLKQGKQPQPYPPYGPFVLPLPLWLWLVAGLVLVGILSGVWAWFQRVQRRRRLRDDLTQHANKTLPPSAQFHKELRQLSRHILTSDTKAAAEWSASLDRSLRVYLLREFEFLTLKVSRTTLFKSWRKRDRPTFDAYSAGLKKIFSEQDRFHTHLAKGSAPDAVSKQDFEQILQISRTWCDQMEKRKARRL